MKDMKPCEYRRAVVISGRKRSGQKMVSKASKGYGASAGTAIVGSMSNEIEIIHIPVYYK